MLIFWRHFMHNDSDWIQHWWQSVWTVSNNMQVQDDLSDMSVAVRMHGGDDWTAWAVWYGWVKRQWWARQTADKHGLAIGKDEDDFSHETKWIERTTWHINQTRRLLRVISTLVRFLRGFLPRPDWSATEARLEAWALALAEGWADSGLLGILDPH